jgi:DNA-binding HxlR family transcriptional regulator
MLLAFCKHRVLPWAHVSGGSSALDLLGDKWSLLVMRDVLLRGKSHYRDFLASEEGIATNILADRLARLEAAGLIERTSDDPRSGKQEYHATGKGQGPYSAAAGDDGVERQARPWGCSPRRPDHRVGQGPHLAWRRQSATWAAWRRSSPLCEMSDCAVGCPGYRVKQAAAVVRVVMARDRGEAGP